jgi:hypothetical protein
MVENVLHSKEFEWKRNQNDVVGRIAPLDDIKAVPQEDPQRIEELPKQGATVFPQIPHRSASLCRRWMPIDTDSVEDLKSFGRPFPSGAQYRHLVSVFSKCTGLPPNTSIEGNRLVLYDDQNPFL